MASIPFSVTEVAPVKFVPVNVTLLPTSPLAGEKLEIVGGGAGTVNVKLDTDVAVPFGVVTEIFPVDAPLGTVAAIWVELVTVNVAAVPLNATEVAPMKFAPLMVTESETLPLMG